MRINKHFAGPSGSQRERKRDSKEEERKQGRRGVRVGVIKVAAN